MLLVAFTLAVLSVNAKETYFTTVKGSHCCLILPGNLQPLSFSDFNLHKNLFNAVFNYFEIIHINYTYNFFLLKMLFAFLSPE